MKKSLVLTLSLVGIMFLLMIGPVSAATGTASITGTAQTVASISVVNPTSSIPLIVGSNTDSSIGLTVTTNTPFSITVADNTYRTTSKGYMGNYSAGYVASPLNTVLTNPMGLSGTSTVTTTAVAVSSPVSTAQPIYSGSAPVSNELLPILATQNVVVADPVLPGTNVYRIDLIFTLTPV